MVSTNKHNGSVLERIFSAASALCFGAVMLYWLITMVMAKELTNVLTVLVLMIVVIVMILNQKNLFATVGIGIFALWKIITFFTGGSITAMWFELASAIALLYLTFLVSRRAKTAKDLRSASLFGWVPGVLSLVGFFFYLSYACNNIAFIYWIYALENGPKTNVIYVVLQLVEVLGVLFAGLWTAFTPVPAEETADAEAVDVTEPIEPVEPVEPIEPVDPVETAADAAATEPAQDDAQEPATESAESEEVPAQPIEPGNDATDTQ